MTAAPTASREAAIATVQTSRQTHIEWARHAQLHDLSPAGCGVVIHPCPHAEQHDLMESCPCGYTAAAADGCWIAYYHDGSGSVVFRTELEALRYALSYSMAVKFARYGDPDWIRADR